MDQLSKIPPSALEKLSPEKHKGIVLNELKREDVLAHIAGLLHDVARLYQIPNWGATESVHLAGWILRNYKYETLDTVTEVLKNPPTIPTERIWRLTPDVIQSWLLVATDRLIAKREEEIHNEPFKELAPLKEEEKQEGVPEEWEDERLTEWLKEIEKVEQKKIPPITQEDILKEGQEKPKKLKPVLPLSSVDIENRDLANKYGVHVNQIKELRIQWGRECHDLYSGRKLPTWITFAEWLTK